MNKLLESCNEHLITGTITVDAAMGTGFIELRAGCAHDSSYDGDEGEAALLKMRALDSGTYELVQRLPKLTGALGSAAECRGSIAQNPVIEIMRLCEDQALSCTITVMKDFDRAEIVYRIGDIEDVLFNGKPDEDSLVDVVKWKTGKFRVTVPPLALDIEGWPTAGKDPTLPFRIADIAKMVPPPKQHPSGPRAIPAKTRDDRPQDSAATWTLFALAFAMVGLWITVAMITDVL